jgi:hypothetical protein
MTRLIHPHHHEDISANPAATITGKRTLSVIRPLVRRGLSRVEAAIYIGVSPSKFDELRKTGRIGPAKVLDGRKLFDVELLDSFFDALPDENQPDNDDWTASL